MTTGKTCNRGANETNFQAKKQHIRITDPGVGPWGSNHCLVDFERSSWRSGVLFRSLEVRLKPTYAELLKDPRWQKKRLEVMEASNFQCSSCGDGEKTLHVHHGVYFKGLMPWEYPDEMLSCLCESCHTRATMEMDVVKEWLAKLDVSHLNNLIGILIAAQKHPLEGKFAGVATECFCNLIGMRSELIVPIVKHYFVVFNQVNDLLKIQSKTLMENEAF